MCWAVHKVRHAIFDPFDPLPLSHISERLYGPSSTGLCGPLVARLASKQQTGIAMLGCYITAHGPCMARLLNVARAIFGLPGIFK